MKEKDQYLETRAREFHGCIHCGGLNFVMLRSTIGDKRDGIRNDRRCLCCGGIEGSTAAMAVAISQHDWYEVRDDPYPLPDVHCVLVMRLLIKLEEELKKDFRRKEVHLVQLLCPLVKTHHQSLSNQLELAKEHVGKISNMITQFKWQASRSVPETYHDEKFRQRREKYNVKRAKAK